MTNQPLIVGGVGMLIGVLLAVAISGSLADGKVSSAMKRAAKASEEAAGAAAAAAAAQDEAVAALNEKIAALEAGLSETAASAAEASEKLGSEMAALKDELSAGMDEFSSTLADLSSSDEGSAAGATSSEKTSSAAEMSSADPVRAGETALFADGTLRVFVSRIDTEGGTVRLSANGTPLSLGVEESASVSLDEADCSIMVMALNDKGATLGSDCGGSAAQSAEAATPPAAPEEGYRAGELAQLADGALRVFVSGLAEDRTSARLAVNGFETQVVLAGDTVEVSAGEQNCTLTVTGVGNGIVGLEGSCG